MAHNNRKLMEALDRFGADFSSWPDRALANDARRLALADRDFRRAVDGAGVLAAQMAAIRNEMDAEIAAAGAVDRVQFAVLKAVAGRYRVRHWRSVAAAVVVAAALGAIVDMTIVAPVGSGSFEVVVLDPLVFDPGATVTP